MDSTLAPIVLFVYNRPEHTLRTLDALSNNRLAELSDLYIFADGCPNTKDDQNFNRVQNVRRVIRKQQWCKNVIIKESIGNKGLAESIINGVSELINKHGKIIVLEDDLITSRGFLEFMNAGLNNYSNQEKVMQISGYNFPIHLKEKNTASFIPLTTTWGWATWKDRWNKIDFECKDYHLLKNNKYLFRKFNLDDSYNYSKMFLHQMESNGRVNSWGIRYWWNVFRMNGLVLYPDFTLVKNIGWDGSGRHGDDYELFGVDSWNESYRVKHFPSEIKTNTEDFLLLKKYLKKELSIYSRVIKKIKKFMKL